MQDKIRGKQRFRDTPTVIHDVQTEMPAQVRDEIQALSHYLRRNKQARRQQ
jgi:hypothetical protein